MSLELSTIAVDPELANKGVWAEFYGGRFLLARKGAEYDNRLGQLYNENLAVIKNKDKEKESQDMVFQIYQRAFTDTVLKDWEGITEDGKELKYTSQVGMRVLSDPRFRELATFLEQFSLNHSNYRTAVEAEVATDVKSSAVS